MTAGFFISAAVTVVGALGVLFFRSAINAALALVTHMIGIAMLYATLDAHFLSVAQIIVYAGAIVVLVLFVIMLLQSKDEPIMPLWRRIVATVLIATVALIVGLYFSGGALKLSDLHGTTSLLGRKVFEDYVFVFESISIVILAAVAGAVMIARRGDGRS